ncbi:spore coat protein [Clostridium magnum]|uniref:Coat F domain protein n=1 Tax=Clostridium magnum DSM 2767 TaxID=1121326 RepID=A0A162UDN6_9CLOT|nr:spore coat protein [Clostridium magnum]KZL93791.1 coat F domain protein [Clostridium magnum DSM 2767]SHI08820.1 similar to spore coat protein [Clostridium magnum DSM 2767]
MSWLDNILGEGSDNSNNNSNGNEGSNNSLNDKDIALDMLVGSKFRIEALAKTITETTNPQLRQMLSGQLNMNINEHFRLSDIAINNQWYNVQATPQQQVQQDVKDAESLSQSQQGS